VNAATSLPTSTSRNKYHNATMTNAKTDRLSTTLSRLRPSFRMTVRAMLLVTFGASLLRSAPHPTNTTIGRFAAATFHLFVTAV
jgi:hypothetical protein